MFTLIFNWINNMNILKKIMGYDDRFFTLLEASVNEARASVQLLAQLLQRSKDGMADLEEFVMSRRKDKKITEEITEQLCLTFVTPFDSEDIEKLSSALYKIPKTAEKFGEKYMLCRDRVPDLNFTRQMDILGKCADTVSFMVAKLRDKTHLGIIKEYNDKLHYLEGEADKIMLELIKGLYGGGRDPIHVLIAIDLYEEIENIIDRCRDAGNVVFQIVLKYS
jgi:uncharacterized protein